jgi:hypothetical protein
MLVAAGVLGLAGPASACGPGAGLGRFAVAYSQMYPRLTRPTGMTTTATRINPASLPASSAPLTTPRGVASDSQSSVPDTVDPEAKADAKLSLAKQLAKEGVKDKARTWYEKIIRDYPDTKAADQAKTLLASAK